MVNTLLNLVNMKIQYERGYSAGLPGFLSVILVGLIIYFFKPIYRFLEFIGIIDFLQKVGIIHPYDGGITLWRLFVAGTIIIVLLTVALAILITIANFAPFIAYLLIPIIFVIGSPLFLLQAIINKLSRHSMIRQCLLRGIKEGKAKIIPFEEVDKNLDRFPEHGEYFFYLAVTHEKEVFALVPRPKGMAWLGREELWGIKLTYPKEVTILKPLPIYENFNGPRSIPAGKIDYVVENRSEAFLEFYKFLEDEKYVLMDYISNTRKDYEERKLSLLEDLSSGIEFNKEFEGMSIEFLVNIDSIKNDLQRLTEIERREATTIFKDGWVYERSPRTTRKI